MKEQNKAFKEMMDDTPEGVYELAPGLTSEEMRSVFFDETALAESPIKVYRLQGTKQRLYYTFENPDEPTFYTSVTTLIKWTMPTSPFLIKWIADMGYDESKVYAQERADYGTFMHKEIAVLLISRKYNTESLADELKSYIEAEKLPTDFINHGDELKKDILSFAQFMIECNVKPIAVEIVVPHPDGYAGAIDLVCEMTLEISDYWGEHYKTGMNAGKPKKTKQAITFTAIVDFKSGKKGFFEEHEIQLQAYKNMWDHNFPGRKIDRLFNWSPKNWRGQTPTYNLKDQTEARSREKFRHLVELSRIETERREKVITIVSGVIDVDKGLSENIFEMSLAELVKKNKEQKDAPKK